MKLIEIYSLRKILNDLFFDYLDKAEPDEDPEVTRAKYFIRDEFLVRKFSFNLFYESRFLFVSASQHGYR